MSRMHSIVLVTLGFVGVAPVCMADTFGPAVIDATLAANVKAVCTSTTLHRSPAAQVACDGGHYPALVAKGDSFANRGTGAEFNALIRQLAAGAVK